MVWNKNITTLSVTVYENQSVLIKRMCTGGPIINATELKIEYLHYDSGKGADFFTSNRSMYKLYIHKDMP